MIDDDKPPLDEALLEHHGVKGQKWGVRRNRDSDGGGSASSMEITKKAGKATADYLLGKPQRAKAKRLKEAKQAAKDEVKAEGGSSKDAYLATLKVRKAPTTAEAHAAMKANEAKSLAKLDPSVSKEEAKEKKGLSPAQKKLLLKVAIGAVVVGGVIYANKRYTANAIATYGPLSGKKIEEETFNKAVTYSKAKSWAGQGYVSEHSLARGEFTIPKGTTFHRISTTAEKSFDQSTYTTHSVEDYNRYLTNFRLEKGGSDLHHITFTAKNDLKIPDVTTVLNTLKESIKDNSGKDLSDKEVLVTYNSISGGNWDHPVGMTLFTKLKNKGYHGLVDEMDAGVIGDSPLVLFGHVGNVTKKVSTVITDSDISEATKNLVELTARKGIPLS